MVLFLITGVVLPVLSWDESTPHQHFANVAGTERYYVVYNGRGFQHTLFYGQIYVEPSGKRILALVNSPSVDVSDSSFVEWLASAFPGTEVYMSNRPVRVLSDGVYEWRIGWPFTAFWCRAKDSVGQTVTVAKSPGVVGGIVIPRGAVWGLFDATRVVPYLPLWPGLLGNLLFCFPFALAIDALFLAVRRRIRHLRFHRSPSMPCPSCSYSLLGLPPNTPCPECGDMPKPRKSKVKKEAAATPGA